MRMERLPPFIKSHPIMRRLFSSIDVSFYNEDIVGPWDQIAEDRERV